MKPLLSILSLSLLLLSSQMLTIQDIPLHTPTVSVLPNSFQVFHDPTVNAGPRLSSGDLVSWGHVAINLVDSNGTFRAWRLTDLGDGVRIAILDTGVDDSIPDLAGQVVAAQDFTGEGYFDGHGHGTAMASIVASKIDGEGMAGVAPKAMLYAGKVLDSRGFGTDETLSAGINWAVEQDVQIISMSLGASGYRCEDLPETFTAVQRALAADIIVVGSAGNSYHDFKSTVGAPANCPGVIAVSASGHERTFQSTPDGSLGDDAELWTDLAFFSSRGAEVDLASPGRFVLAWWGGSLGLVSGTSPAAPYAAGLFALMLNRYGEYANIDSRLPQVGNNEFSFKGGRDFYYGYGLIDSLAALSPRGDVNGDNEVDIIDLTTVGISYGSTLGDPNYSIAADQNLDDSIDLLDLEIVQARFGYSLFTSNVSAWSLGHIVYRGISQGSYDKKLALHGTSASPDVLTVTLRVNPRVWDFLNQSRTVLNVTVWRDPNLTSLGWSDLLSTGTYVFEAYEGEYWYLLLFFSTEASTSEAVSLLGFTVTISSDHGFSHETPAFIFIGS